MEDLMKSFEKYRDTRKEIDYLFNETNEEYDDINIRSIKGERFVCRDSLSDFYSKLTEEQKKLISQFEVLLGGAIIEDREDKEYNLKNYNILRKNFSIKGGITIGS